MEPDLGETRRGQDKKANAGRLGILWSFAYYTLLVLGAYSWWHYLWPLTESDMALAKF